MIHEFKMVIISNITRASRLISIRRFQGKSPWHLSRHEEASTIKAICFADHDSTGLEQGQPTNACAIQLLKKTLNRCFRTTYK